MRNTMFDAGKIVVVKRENNQKLLFKIFSSGTDKC